MRWFVIFILILFSFKTFSQIRGVVYDSIDKKPIEYINIWKKNRKIGGTTNNKGEFYIDLIKESDTIVLSCLGYREKTILAKKNDTLYLSLDEYQLEEVVIKTSKNTRFNTIRNYKKLKKIKSLFFIGKDYQYKLALFIPNSEKINKTSFLQKLVFVSNNSLDYKVKMRISIVSPKDDGSPSDFFHINELVDISSGINENEFNIDKEKIIIPKEGFFIVFERLFNEENKLYNKFYETNKKLIEYSYQPSLGVVKAKSNDNVWWGYGGKWFKAPENGYSKFYSLKFSEPAVKLMFSN